MEADLYSDLVIKCLKHRSREGIRKYHLEQSVPQFVGDPMKHAIEELLDLVFYLWVLGRKQRHQQTCEGWRSLEAPDRMEFYTWARNQIREDEDRTDLEDEVDVMAYVAFHALLIPLVKIGVWDDYFSYLQ